MCLVRTSVHQAGAGSHSPELWLLAKSNDVGKSVCRRVQQMVVLILEELVEERYGTGSLGLGCEARRGGMLGDRGLVGERFMLSVEDLEHIGRVGRLVEELDRAVCQTGKGTVHSEEGFL